jgi:elongation factor P
MSIPATQLRPGMIIKHNNDLHSVFSVEHRTPGNLRAFIQAKLRNLRTGAMFEHRFRSPDPIEKVNVDEVNMEFLYADGDSYYFMDTENYEQTHLTRDILGDAVDYLTSNLQIKVEFFDGKAVGIELPQTVILTVVEVEPGLKSATASSVTKPAKTETGLVVQVPPVHQRRRENQGRHRRRHIFVASVVRSEVKGRSEVRGQIAEVVEVRGERSDCRGRSSGWGFHLCNLTSDLCNRKVLTSANL